MNSRPVRVRIAPSPTGYFHVGTARTAIYNYLFARHHGGKFILRIEDTDIDRSEAQYVDVILDGLKWLNVKWDEGPIHQSERTELYRPPVQELLDSGKAYRCFCTPSELEAERKAAIEQKTDWKYSRRCRHLSAKQIAEFEAAGKPGAVRLAVPEEGETGFHDLVAGDLNRRNEDIEDFVIARSDGRALYNFAVVVDDHLMQISHVIRGNDHITNTFKQALLYRALGWEEPQFAHLPLILGRDRSKISKRKGDPSVTDYRDQGYLPEALLNFLCLLGWSAGDDREIYSLDELIKVFDISRVNPANPVFDPAKLEWMNGEYIRHMSAHDLGERAKPFLFEAGLITPLALETRWAWYLKVVEALRERCKVLRDFATSGAYFFKAPRDYEPAGAEKHFTSDGAAERLRKLAGAWGEVREFDAAALESATKALAQAGGEKAAAYIHVARLALSGMTTGPGFYELAALLGPRECKARLVQAAEAIETNRVTLRQPVTEGDRR
jgi:glutamyl-tRNA synthetase